MLATLGHFIFPKKCPFCRNILKKNQQECADCIDKISLVTSPFCTICHLPYESPRVVSHPCPACLEDPPDFLEHRALFVYKRPLSFVIHRIKYEGELKYLDYFTERILSDGPTWLNESDFLIPVPLHRNRLAERTFNQSLEWAKSISKNKKIPFLPHSLQRIKDTPRQTFLKREERIENMKNAFKWLGEENIAGKNIVLIDDVYTTGSTLAACAREIKKLKPASIKALTMAIREI